MPTETPAQESWYIVKQASGQCDILATDIVEATETESSEVAPSEAEDNKKDEDPIEKWGPFKAKNQAIAKRVGLIRAGKCQPS